MKISKEQEQQIAQMMRALSISREEAIELLAEDDDIDHDIKKDYDLTAEQQKNAQIYQKSGNYTRKSEPSKRERKADNEKREIIARIEQMLQNFAEYEQISVKNIEKEVCFSLNGAEFSISLIKHRPPKAK